MNVTEDLGCHVGSWLSVELEQWQKHHVDFICSCTRQLRCFEPREPPLAGPRALFWNKLNLAECENSSRLSVCKILRPNPGSNLLTCYHRSYSGFYNLTEGPEQTDEVFQWLTWWKGICHLICRKHALMSIEAPCCFALYYSESQNTEKWLEYSCLMTYLLWIYFPLGWESQT